MPPILTNDSILVASKYFHWEFSMIAFLDIEGVFSNNQPQAILNELDNLRVLVITKICHRSNL